MLSALDEINGIARTLARETGGRFVDKWRVPSIWRSAYRIYFTRSCYASLAAMLMSLCE